MTIGRSMLILGCLGVAAVSGCRGDGQGGQPARAPEASTSAAPPVTVAVFPAAPTAEDDLQIETSVEDIESCRWRRNSVVLEDIKVGCLPRGNFAKGDVISATVVANGREAMATVTVRNSPPKVRRVFFLPAEFHRGVDVRAEIEAVDPDGDPVRYRLAWIVNGEERVWEDSPVLPGDRFSRGDRLALQVTPSDGEDEGEMFRSSEMVVPNAQPKFVTAPPAKFEGEKFSYAARAEDPDGDPLLYLIEKGPPGMSIDPQTGNVTWSRCLPGEHQVRIKVRDDRDAEAVQELRLLFQPPG